MLKRHFKTKALTAGVMVGVLGGVGATHAAPNPFSNSNSTSSQTQTAPSGSGSTVEEVRSMGTGTSSAPAKQTPHSTTTATISSNRHSQAPDSTATATNNVKDAANACAVANHAEEVQIARLEAVDAGPSRVKAMENIETHESTKGCLSSSKEILDLTVALPTIRGSWGDIGQIVRKQVDKEIQKIQKEVIHRTCEIADKAVRDAAAPVLDFYKTWNGVTTIINGSDATVGKYLSDKVTDSSGKVGRYLNDRLNSAQKNLDSANQKVNNKYQGYKNGIDDHAYEAIGFNIGDADAQVNGILKQQIEAEMEDVRRSIPPKPQYTANYRSDGNYYKCDSSGRCTLSNMTEYRQINNEHRTYNDAVERTRTQLGMLQKQLTEVGRKPTAPVSQPQPITLGQNQSAAPQSNTQHQAQPQAAQAAAPTASQRVQNTTNAVNETAQRAQEQRFSISQLNPFANRSTTENTDGSSSNNRFAN